MEWYLIAFISALLSALAAIAEKKALTKNNVLEFSTFVAIFSFLFSLPFLFVIDFSKITLLSFFVLFFKTILNAVAFYSIMSALKKLDISNSLPLMDLSPGIVAVLAAVFLNEMLNIYQIIGLILLILGTYLINLKQNIKFLEPFTIFVKSKAHMFILLALLCFTITSILDKVLVGNLNIPPETFMFLQQLLTLFIFITAFIIIKKEKALSAFKVKWKNFFGLIILIGFLTVGYRYAQIVAVKEGKVALVLAIKRTSVFLACLIGGILFKDKNLLRRIIATVILITGGALIIIF